MRMASTNRSCQIALYPNYHELVNHVLQTLMYACQHMADDKLLRDYHVPPVSSPTLSISLAITLKELLCYCW